MLKEFTDWVESQTSLIKGSTLQVGHRLASAPQNCNLIRDAGGDPNGWLKDQKNWHINVVSRGDSFFTARDQAYVIYDLIHDYVGLTIGDGAEIVLNPIFADWIIDPSKPDNWVVAATVPGTYTKETENPYSGANCVKLYSPAASNAYMYQAGISLVAGKSYRLKIAFRGNEDYAGWAWYFKPGGIYMLPDGNFWTTQAYYNYFYAQANWKTQIIDFVSPQTGNWPINITEVSADISPYSLYIGEVSVKNLDGYYVNIIEAVEVPQPVGKDKNGLFEFSTNYVLRLGNV